MLSHTQRYKDFEVTVNIDGTVITPFRLSTFDLDHIRMTAAGHFLAEKGIKRAVRLYWSAVLMPTSQANCFSNPKRFTPKH